MPISMGMVGERKFRRAFPSSFNEFNEGTSVKLITQLNGDVIVHVKESRVAINKEQARHILV